MGPLTVLHYYRPTPPPPLTGRDVGAFLGRLAETGLVAPRTSGYAHVGFGTLPEVEAGATRGPERETGSITWALQQSTSSLMELGALLGRHHDSIARAFLTLGELDPGVAAALQPEGAGEDALAFDGCGFTIGPVLSGRHGQEETFAVGWMALSVMGTGELPAGSLRDHIARAEACPAVRAAMELLRTTWPVEPAAPPPGLVRVRKRMGELWPYAACELPLDWSWGLHEAG